MFPTLCNHVVYFITSVRYMVKHLIHLDIENNSNYPQPTRTQSNQSQTANYEQAKQL